MTIKVVDAPADHQEHWRIECSDDEPADVQMACKALTDQVQRRLRHPPSRASLMAWIRNERERAKKANGQPSERMRRALFAMAGDLHLDRDDRMDLAEVVLDRDIESWSELSYDDARRLLDVLSGYVLVRHLRIERSKGPRR